MKFFVFDLIDYIKTNHSIEIDWYKFKTDTSNIVVELIDFSKSDVAEWNRKFTLGFVIRHKDFDELTKTDGIMDLLETCFDSINRLAISDDFYIFGINKDEPIPYFNDNYFCFLWKLVFNVKDKRKL